MSLKNEPEDMTKEITTMKKWVLRAGGTSLDDMEIQIVPIPEPSVGQVRVRVKAASLNYRDQVVLTGTYGPVSSDLIPLSDGAGEIDALGEGVIGWQIGQRVTTVYSPEEWIDGPPTPGLTFGLGAEGLDGVLAEYIVISANRISAAPKSWNFAEAATIPCAAVTAWTALNGDRPYAKKFGQTNTVLALGTGGVSLFSLLFAKALGAKTYGTSSMSSKIDRLKQLGIDYAVNYGDYDDWGIRIFNETGGVDRVVNTVGSSAIEQSIIAVGYGGEIATMGMFDLGGQAPNYIALMMKGASIRGTAVGSHAAHKDLIAFLDKYDHIKPPIDKLFTFSDAKAAYKAAINRDLFGKIVIEID